MQSHFELFKQQILPVKIVFEIRIQSLATKSFELSVTIEEQNCVCFPSFLSTRFLGDDLACLGTIISSGDLCNQTFRRNAEPGLCLKAKPYPVLDVPKSIPIAQVITDVRAIASVLPEV